MKRLLVFLWLVIACLPLASSSQEPFVPEPLSPWVEWVKDQDKDSECAWLEASPVCSFPGRVAFQLSASQTRFELEVELLRNSQIPIPGSQKLTPRSLEIRSETGAKNFSPLIFKKGAYSVKLPKGRYSISGLLVGSSYPPAELPIPKSLGLWSAQSSDNLKFERRGDKLVLINDSGVSQQKDSLSLRVFRKAIDGSPLKLISLLELNISGSSRPIDFGRILPDGALPASIRSSLPHLLKSTGELSLQATPGQHEVVVEAYLSQPVESISLPKLRLTDQEVFVFDSNSKFRTVEIEGPKPIFENIASIPATIKGDSTFIANSGQEIVLKTLKRGLENTRENNISLLRQIWPNITGKGYKVEDQFNGKITGGFRLNALDETKLGRASDSNGPLLITSDPSSGQRGLQLNTRALNIKTMSSYESSRAFSAIGWDTDVRNLNMRLHLPPSWMLFRVSGAGHSNTSWLGSWELLSVFFGAIVILATFKLIGPTASILVALSFLLNHQEFMAPRGMFIHLLLLMAWRKLITEPKSIFSSICRILLSLTYGVLLLQTLAFSKLQFTQFLYPQLQAGTRHRSLIQTLVSGLDQYIVLWPILIGVSTFLIVAVYRIWSAKGFKLKLLSFIKFGFIGLMLFWFSSVAVGGLFFVASPEISRVSSPSGFNNLAETVEIAAESDYLQTKRRLSLDKSKLSNSIKDKARAPERRLSSGPSKPDWSWRSHVIQVEMPIAANEKLDLKIVEHPVVRILCALRVIISLCLLSIIFKAVFGNRFEFINDLRERIFSLQSGALARSAIILFLSLGLSPGVLKAEFPEKELLDDLGQRLAESVCKEKDCLSIQEASFQFEKSTFELVLLVNSRGRNIVRIPGPLKVLTPNTILVNGKESAALRSVGDFLEMKIEPGATRISIVGSLPKQAAFSISFPDPVIYTEVLTEDWFVEGIRESGKTKKTIRLSSLGSSSQNVERITKSSSKLPGFFKISREIEISDTSNILTTVSRSGDVSSGGEFRVPLFKGERVTTQGLSSNANFITLNFPPDKRVITFSSLIEELKSPWKLSTPTHQNASESWSFSCDISYSCNFFGLSPTSNYNGDRLVRTFTPFPGEELRLEWQQLESIPGESLTIDSINHTVNWGSRLQKGTIRLKVRATEQERLLLEMEPGYKLEPVGSVSNQIFDGNRAEVILSPGSHSVDFSYSASRQIDLLERTPGLKLNHPSANIRTNIRPGEARWLLWTGGPLWGPSVVYWSKALVFIAILVFLSRLAILPISTTGSVLLAIGLASLPVFLFWIPIVWLASISLLDGLTKRFRRGLVVSLFGVLTVLSLALFYRIISLGLLLSPPMLLAGNRSNSSILKWYSDYSGNELVQPWVLSLPIEYWRGLSLLWALWLVVAAYRWLKTSAETIRTM